MNSLKQYHLNQLNRAIEVHTDDPLSTDITLRFPYESSFHRELVNSWVLYGWIQTGCSASFLINVSLTTKGLTDVLYYRL